MLPTDALTLRPDAPRLTPLVTTRELAALLGTTVDWLENARSAGHGPPFLRLSPHQVRYSVADVMAWLDAARQSGAR